MNYGANDTMGSVAKQRERRSDSGATDGMALGMADGATGEMMNGTADSMADSAMGGMMGGMTDSMADGAASSAIDVRVYLGLPGTGKTHALADRAAALVEGGAAAHEILALAATPDTARALSARLRGRGGAVAHVRVETPQAFALELLHAHSDKRRLRQGRLLAPFELDFLIEDMKTSGLAPKRLRGMLRFFEQGIADGERFDMRWLINDEERSTFDQLQRCLDFEGGILAAELAAEALALTDHLDAMCLFDHVLVDDFQLMSRTSQLLAERLARASLTVAADETASFPAFEKHPYAEGISDLVDRHGLATIVELTDCRRNPRAHAAVRAIRGAEDSCPLGEIKGGAASENDRAGQTDSEAKSEAKGTTESETRGAGGKLPECEPESEIRSASGGSGPRSCTVTGYASPQDEIAAAVERISEMAGEGSGDIAVVTPHRAWSRQMTRMLATRGILAEEALSGAELSSSIASLDGSLPARAATLLMLAANPIDSIAWRSWCGFGDPLGNSLGIAEIHAEFGYGGAALAEALKRAKQHGETPDLRHPKQPREATRFGRTEQSKRAAILARPKQPRDESASRRARQHGEKIGFGYAEPHGETPRLSRSAQRVLAAYESGMSLIEKLASCTGTSLTEQAVELCAHIEGCCITSEQKAKAEALLRRFTQPSPTDDPYAQTAGDLAARMMRRIAFPLFEHDDAVRVGPMERFAETEVGCMLFVGFSNGLFPHRAFFDRTQMDHRTAKRAARRDTALFSSCVGCACRDMHASYFTTIELERAERLGISIDRIQLHGGRKQARITPSIYLEKLTGNEDNGSTRKRHRRP